MGSSAKKKAEKKKDFQVCDRSVFRGRSGRGTTTGTYAMAGGVSLSD